MPQISYTRLALLLVVSLCVFFTELGTARLWDRDEPRNARASHEMLDRGDWIVPTFNGELRDHKPVLLYWGQMLAYLGLGESEFTARLPSALCGILTVLATALLASRLSGTPRGINLAGFWSACVMATSLLFVLASRAATPDACLIAFSTLGITCLVVGSLSASPPFSSGNVGSLRWIPMLAGYGLLGIAVLAKGPVGLILPLAVVHLWWMLCFRLQSEDNSAAGQHDKPLPTEVDSQRAVSGRLRANLLAQLHFAWKAINPVQCCRAVWHLKTLPGVLVSLLVAAPWYAAVGIETDGAFLRGFFLEHNVGRALTSMEGHSGGLLFYPMALLVGTFPWSLWLIPIVTHASKLSGRTAPERQMTVLSICWIIVYVGAFTVASTKLPSYITPCYVGVALLVGGFLRSYENGWELPSRTWRLIGHGVTCLAGIALTIAIAWLSQQQDMPLISRAAWGGVALLAAGIAGFLLERTTRLTLGPAIWTASAVAFNVALFAYGSKSVDHYRGDLDLLVNTKSSLNAKSSTTPLASSTRWMTVGGLEPSWVHYLNENIQEIRTSADNPKTWLEVTDALRTSPDKALIVVGDEANKALRKVQTNLDSNLDLLTMVGQADRFLRPGQLTVWRIPPERFSQAALAQPIKAAQIATVLQPQFKHSGIAVRTAAKTAENSKEVALPDMLHSSLPIPAAGSSATNSSTTGPNSKASTHTLPSDGNQLTAEAQSQTPSPSMPGPFRLAGDKKMIEEPVDKTHAGSQTTPVYPPASSSSVKDANRLRPQDSTPSNTQIQYPNPLRPHR